MSGVEVEADKIIAYSDITSQRQLMQVKPGTAYVTESRLRRTNKSAYAGRLIFVLFSHYQNDLLGRGGAVGAWAKFVLL
jgi:hypothetical protein